MNQSVAAIGIDIGGTKIAAAVVNGAGAVTDLHTVPTPETPRIIATMAALCRDLLALAQQRGQPIGCVGVGAAGQVNSQAGEIVYAVETLPGWTGTPVAAQLGALVGLPVLVENDVNAVAAGEMRFGAGRGFQRALYAAIGTGIGGALIANGHIEAGAHWSAGEIGHTMIDIERRRMCNCGQAGHLEAYASGPAMARRYCQLTGIAEHRDLRAVTRLAEAGDPQARAAIEEGARIFGLALNGMVSLYDPEVLVIGGGVPEVGPLWWTPFEAALRQGNMPAPKQVALRRAELGWQAALVGAAALALEAYSV
jgi:glucokinase